MFFNSTTKYIILRDFSIREALKFQNENDDKFLIVVDNSGKLVGVVTEGFHPRIFPLERTIKR